MSYRHGAAVQFVRPGAAGQQTFWSGTIEEVQKDGNLLIRDTTRKLRVVPSDSRWLTVVEEAILPPPFPRQV